jgi:release factor glutamine methyltransferase
VTVREVIDAAVSHLDKKQVKDSRLKCELLMARLLSCRPLELSLQYDVVPSESKLSAMRRGLKRLAAGEPVQYILGETEFMGHKFKSDSRALIPRPETECLVELVLASEELWRGDNPAIVEVGTGTGCIVISLAKKHPEALYIALDIDEEALKLAGENAASLGVTDRIAFTNGEMGDIVEPDTIDAVVANLPYIPSNVVDGLPIEIRDHEPRTALDGGPDGLAVLGPVIDDASFALKVGGSIFLEMGEEQGSEVMDLLTKAGFCNIQLHKDLAGKERIATGVRGSD